MKNLKPTFLGNNQPSPLPNKGVEKDSTEKKDPYKDIYSDEYKEKIWDFLFKYKNSKDKLPVENNNPYNVKRSDKQGEINEMFPYLYQIDDDGHLKFDSPKEGFETGGRLLEDYFSRPEITLKGVQKEGYAEDDKWATGVAQAYNQLTPAHYSNVDKDTPVGELDQEALKLAVAFHEGFFDGDKITNYNHGTEDINRYMGWKSFYSVYQALSPKKRKSPEKEIPGILKIFAKPAEAATFDSIAANRRYNKGTEIGEKISKELEKKNIIGDKTENKTKDKEIETKPTSGSSGSKIDYSSLIGKSRTTPGPGTDKVDSDFWGTGIEEEKERGLIGSFFQETEKIRKSLVNSMKRTWHEGIKKGFGLGLYTISEATEDLLGLEDKERWLEEKGLRIAERAENYIKYHPELLPSEDFKPFFEGGWKEVENYGEYIGSMAAYSIPMALLAFLPGGRAISFTTMSLVETGSAYSYFTEEAGLDEEDAVKLAPFVGVINAKIENSFGVMPSKAATGLFRGGGVKKAAKLSMKKFMLDAFKKIGMTAIEEGGEEIAQKFVQDFSPIFLKEAVPELEEEYLRQYAEAFAGGFIGGGAMGGGRIGGQLAGRQVSKAKEKIQKKKQEKKQPEYTGLNTVYVVEHPDKNVLKQLGEGNYVARNAKSAAKLGSGISEASVQLDNPLVLESNEKPQKYGYKPVVEEQTKDGKIEFKRISLSDWAKEQGYDAIVLKGVEKDKDVINIIEDKDIIITEEKGLVEEAKEYGTMREFLKSKKSENIEEIEEIEIPKEIKEVEPQKATGTEQKEFLNRATVGNGAYQVGEVYEQEIETGNVRPVQITKVNEDGTFNGWYLGSGFKGEVKAFKGTGNLIPGYNFTKEQLSIPPYSQDKLNEYVSKAFKIEPAVKQLKPGKEKEIITKKETKEKKEYIEKVIELYKERDVKIDDKMKATLDNSYYRRINQNIENFINKEQLVEEEKVKEEKKKISKGEKPVILSRYQDGIANVVSGSNTFEAYKQLGIKEIPTLQRVTMSELLRAFEKSRKLIEGVETSKSVGLREVEPGDVKVDIEITDITNGDKLRDQKWKEGFGHYSTLDSFSQAQELISRLNNQGEETFLIKHKSEQDILLNNKYEILISKKSHFGVISPKNIKEQRTQAESDEWARLRGKEVARLPAELFVYREYTEDIEPEELRGKYENFKGFIKNLVNVNETIRDVITNGDLDSFVNGDSLKRKGYKPFYEYKYIKEEAKKQGISPKNYLSQMFADSDEILSLFREKLSKRDPVLLYGSESARGLQLETIYDNDINNEVKTTKKKGRKSRKVTGYETLNKESQEEMTTLPLPKYEDNPHLLALQGDKRASLEIFKKLILHYVKDNGKTRFVEPYGGGFNLALFAVADEEILNSGLKHYYVNIFDSTKAILLRNVVDKGLKRTKLKNLYEDSRYILNEEIKKVAGDFPEQQKVINEFLEKHPGKFIGGSEWLVFNRGINKESGKISLSAKGDKIRQKKWVRLFQKAINNLYFEENQKKGILLNKLDDDAALRQSVMNEFLKKIGVKASKNQKFVGDKGLFAAYGQRFKTDSRTSFYSAIDTMYDNIQKIMKSDVILHLYTKDGGQLVNDLKINNKKAFYYFDPPYINSSKVYEDTKNMKNFLSGKNFIESHKRAFEQYDEGVNKGKTKADIILTNDIDQEWIDSMKSTLKDISLMGYLEHTTPTSLIFTGDYKNEILEHLDSFEKSGLQDYERFLNSFEKTKKSFISSPQKIKLLDRRHEGVIPKHEIEQYERSYAENYLKNKARGEGWSIIENLANKGVSADIIDKLQIKGHFLDEISKLSRSRKDIDDLRIVSKKTIQYILNNSNTEKVNPNDIIKKKDLSFKQKMSNLWNVIEVPSKFFRRLGDGFYNVIFDPIDSSEKKATKIETELIKKTKSVFRLGRSKNVAKLKGLEETEAIRVGKFLLQKRGLKIPKDQQIHDLTAKERKAVISLRRMFKEFFPQVKNVANKMGIDLKEVENYSPMYLKSNVDTFRYGDFYEATRNDPFFASVKEQVANIQWDMYETDIRKVMDVWIQNASRYVAMSEATRNTKFLLLNKDFRDNVPEHIQKSIVNWLDYVITGGNNAPKIIKMLRKAQGTFILGLRYATMAKQFLNLLDAAVFMKKGDMLKTLKYVIKNRKNFFASEEAKQRTNLFHYIGDSPVIKQRMIDITMMDLNGSFLDVLKKPVMWADRATARIIKLTFMRKMIEDRTAQGKALDGKTFKNIEKFTDNLVNGLMGAISRSETPRGLRNEWGKNVFMFYSQLNAKMGYHIQDIWLRQNKNLFTEFSTPQRSAIIGSITALILAAYLETFISNLYPGDDPEEIAEETLYALLGNFPLIGPMSFSFRSGKPFMPAPLVANMIYFFQEVNLIDQSKSESTKKKHLLNAMWTLMGFAGVPRQLKNTIEGYQIAKEGKLDIGNESVYLYDWYDYFLTVLNGKYGSVEVQKWLKDNY